MITSGSIHVVANGTILFYNMAELYSIIYSNIHVKSIKYTHTHTHTHTHTYMLHSICQQIWKTQQWPQDWKRSVFIPIPKKGNAKECSNYHTSALISHTSKIMLKILQARLQNFQTSKLDLEEAEEPEIKLPVSAGSWKKQESTRKTSISALLTMPKPLTVWITINCGKF